jgi:hypothetical protein
MNNEVFKGKESFFVPPNNKYGLNFGDVINFTNGNFSFVTRVSIDKDEIIKHTKETGQIEYGIIMKNGLHCGISVVCSIHENPVNFYAKGTIWTKNGTDEHKFVDILINSDNPDVEDTGFLDIAFSYDKDEKFISLYCNGAFEKKLFNEEPVDYTNSYLWVGAANPLDDCPPEYRSFFYGKIHYGAIYKKCLSHNSIQKVFKNIEVVDSNYKPLCVFNFTNQTPYKILDISDNGNHLIKFDREIYKF